MQVHIGVLEDLVLDGRLKIK